VKRKKLHIFFYLNHNSPEVGASKNKKWRRYFSFSSAIDNAQSASGPKIDGLKVP
jgi:hypothetical protein